MKKLKVTFILPDDAGEGWRKRIPSTLNHFPDFNDKVWLCNDNGSKTREFSVTGVSSWTEKRLWWNVEKIEVYLDNAPMLFDFTAKL